MKENNCNIIKDVLPLYVDDVVSEDTKKMVNNHLEDCQECRKELDLMKKEIYIPAEKEITVIKNFNKKFKQKKLIVSAISIILTGLMLFGMFFLTFHYARFIPYSESLIKIQEEGDELVSHYYGESYYGTSAIEPIKLEIDGKEKNVMFFYYTKTISDSPTRKLFKNKYSSVESEFTFILGKKENIDAIYYTEFSSPFDMFSKKIETEEEQKAYYDDLIETGELVWRR